MQYAHSMSVSLGLGFNFLGSSIWMPGFVDEAVTPAQKYILLLQNIRVLGHPKHLKLPILSGVLRPRGFSGFCVFHLQADED